MNPILSIYLKEILDQKRTKSKEEIDGNDIAEIVAKENPADVEALLEVSYKESGKTVKETWNPNPDAIDVSGRSSRNNTKP